MELKIAKYNLVLHSQPLEILNRFTQYNKNDLESGGILIGKIIEGHINILKLSIPTVMDKASRSNFERNMTGAQIILEYEFANSNGQLIYLGEWHTHPEPYPTPSPTDLIMINKQFKTNQLVTEFLCLLIKGTKGMYMSVIDKQGLYELKIVLQ